MTPSKADIAALIDDVFFLAKVLETAKQVGVEVHACTTAEGLDAEIAKSAPRLVVVDLNAASNPLQTFERLRTRGAAIPSIGFLSHVQVELAEQARAAGCGEVMPRSKFTQNLATILARAKSDTQ